MYYKTDNIKLKNKILYEINKYKKLNEICLIKNPNIKENIIHKLSNDFLFIIKLHFINDEKILKNIIDFLIINSVGEELFMKILQKQPVTQLLKN